MTIADTSLLIGLLHETDDPRSDVLRSESQTVADTAVESVGKPPFVEPSADPVLATQARERFHDPRRYSVVGEHGRGGLGRVSRAYDRELGRDVAIKELLSRTDGDEVRFLREARITARLEHPGIVPVHEVGRWADGTPFYAMKLVAGRSLRDLIAERTTVNERIGLLHHVIAVADAMAYAHDRKIIHRDLKPANVIVGEFGETIVIDWGLAKELDVPDVADPLIPERSELRATRNDDLTTVGSVLGTPAYMAPEQERGEQVDQRADVFAIGAMLWELCSLQRVPPNDLKHRRRLLRRARIDNDLGAIINKALERDPRRRYRDAGTLAVDLNAFKSGARINARSYSPLGILAHWTRRHRTLVFSMAAFICLLVTSVVALAALYRSSLDSAQRANNALIDSWVQQGQRELLAGDYVHALPFLAQAYRSGDKSVAVRAMLHRAIKLADMPRVRMSDRARAAVFRNAGRELFAIGKEGDAAVIDAMTGSIIAKLPGIPARSHQAAFSKDGALVAVTGTDSIVIWDGNNTRLLSMNHRIDHYTFWMTFVTDNNHLAIADNSSISMWNITDGTLQWSQSITGFARYIQSIGDKIAVLTFRSIAGEGEYRAWLVSEGSVRDLGLAQGIAAIDGDKRASCRLRR